MQCLADVVGEGRTVLVPTAEIAAAIIERLEQGFAASGRGVWPTPGIRDFTGWVREQYESQCLDSDDAPRILEDIEERQIWRDVIASSVIATHFADAAGAARAARGALRAMRDHGISMSALQSFPSLETAALRQWSEAFEERCRQLRAIGPDRILRNLARTAESCAYIGSPSWRPGALAWLKANAGTALQPLSVNAARASRSMRVFKSFDAELAGCAAWARTALAGEQRFQGWVYVPNLLERRALVSGAFDAALEPGRFSMREPADGPAYAIAGGTPLARFEPVRIALRSLSAMTQTLSFAEFSALLRDPALQSETADACLAARVDRSLRQRGPSEGLLSTWIRLSQGIAAQVSGTALQAAERLLLMHQRLTDSPAPRLPSHWAAAWIGALEAGPWLHRARWSSAAFQAAERFRELIGSLARADAVFGPRTLSAAVNALSSAAMETAFQPQTGQARVWITGQLVDPWLNYDGLWVLGASAQTWPPPPSPLPLLPVQLQRQFAVPGSSAASQLERAVDLQERWLTRAADVVFSCSSESDLAALPSPLLAAQLPIRQETDRDQDPLWRVLAAQVPEPEWFTDDNGPRFTAQESVRGTHGLRQQSLCPFRGFAAIRLHAEPLEFPQPGFTDFERGLILHRALQLIWERLRDSATLNQVQNLQLHEWVLAAVERAVATAVNKRDPGANWSARERRRLMRLLPQWLSVERRREPFEISELEASRRFSAAGLDFNIRVDRIDKLADGSLALLDYKSGAVSRDWGGARPENPQLPIYALSVGSPVAAIAYARVNADDCRFLGLAERDSILPQVNANLLEGGSGMPAQLALWAQRLDAIAMELALGEARVAPQKNACRSCSLQTFCRIAESAQALAGAGVEAGESGEPA